VEVSLSLSLSHSLAMQFKYLLVNNRSLGRWLILHDVQFALSFHFINCHMWWAPTL